MLSRTISLRHGLAARTCNLCHVMRHSLIVSSIAPRALDAHTIGGNAYSGTTHDVSGGSVTK